MRTRAREECEGGGAALSGITYLCDADRRGRGKDINMGEGGGRGEKCRHQSRRGSFESCNYLETVEMLREKKQDWMMDDLYPNSMNIYQTTCIVWFLILALINGASDHFSHLKIGRAHV